MRQILKSASRQIPAVCEAPTLTPRGWHDHSHLETMLKTRMFLRKHKLHIEARRSLNTQKCRVSIPIAVSFWWLRFSTASTKNSACKWWIFFDRITWNFIYQTSTKSRIPQNFLQVVYHDGMQTNLRRRFDSCGGVIASSIVTFCTFWESWIGFRGLSNPLRKLHININQHRLKFFFSPMFRGFSVLLWLGFEKVNSR